METRLIGKIISRRFRVEDIIGRGGMAIVYRAFDLKTHQTVAIKVLREEYAEDPEYKERFRREGEVCPQAEPPERRESDRRGRGRRRILSGNGIRGRGRRSRN